jgi:hypothetical protein
MPSRRASVERPSRSGAANGDVLEPRDATLLDLLDRLIEQGVMANGDLTLGVAGIDLIHVRLAALLCDADRVTPAEPRRTTRRRPSRQLPRR